MADDKLRDGRMINFPNVPWHRANGNCPVLDEPCACKSLGRDFCRQLAANGGPKLSGGAVMVENEKSPGE